MNENVIKRKIKNEFVGLGIICAIGAVLVSYLTTIY